MQHLIPWSWHSTGLTCVVAPAKICVKLTSFPKGQNPPNPDVAVPVEVDLRQTNRSIRIDGFREPPSAFQAKISSGNDRAIFEKSTR